MWHRIFPARLCLQKFMLVDIEKALDMKVELNNHTQSKHNRQWT